MTDAKHESGEVETRWLTAEELERIRRAAETKCPDDLLPPGECIERGPVIGLQHRSDPFNHEETWVSRQRDTVTLFDRAVVYCRVAAQREDHTFDTHQFASAMSVPPSRAAGLLSNVERATRVDDFQLHRVDGFGRYETTVWAAERQDRGVCDD